MNFILNKAKSISLIAFLLIGVFSIAQRNYKVFFYPDSILVNGEIQITDTVSSKLSSNGKTRVVIWQNELNKLSVFFKVKTTDKKIKTKSRIEIYKNGRWKKAKFRIRLIEKRFLRMSRWTSKEWTTISSMILSHKSEFNIKKVFEGDQGEKIEVFGRFEAIWK